MIYFDYSNVHPLVSRPAGIYRFVHSLVLWINKQVVFLYNYRRFGTSHFEILNHTLKIWILLIIMSI